MTAIQTLRFVPGYRLIDGSDLNIMVDVLNGTIFGTFTGTFNGVVGGTTPAAATVTTLHATGAATLDSTLAVTGAITATGGLNGAVGGVTPAAGAFTTVSGTAFTGTYFTASAYFDESTSDALTAAGTTRTDALALTTAINNVTTAALNTGVVLPSAATVGVGGHVIIYNNGVNPIKVYAAGTDTIDGTAGSTGVTLTNALRCEYRVTAAGKFLSAKLGATST